MSWFGRVRAFLRAHPAVLLVLLSPGIPEYLSGSSPVNAIVLNPGQFAFQIVANLGLYGPGVLLVREAKVRWNKGLASVLLLGAAYGILEEGIALSTLFDPNANPVGTLGTYGHWLGVNWIWAASILPVHMIFSISLPIMLLGLALPETRERSFLPGRKAGLALAVLAADVALLFLAVLKAGQYWMGWPVLLGSCGTVGVLVLAARLAPAGALESATDLPRVGPKVAAVVGAAFYPVVLVSQFGPASAGVPAAVDFVLVLLVQAAFLVFALRILGRHENERVRLGLAIGLIAPIAAFGVVAERALPLILMADLLAGLFFMRVWRRYPSVKAAGEPKEKPAGEEPSAPIG